MSATSPYEDDLAYVQAAAFGDFAAGAMTAVLSRLRAAGVRRVVDVGCGAGVTTRALVEAGFEVTAIEPSSALIAIARQGAPDARFVHASAYDVELPACEAILAIGEPLTYHPPEADADGALQSFFRKAASALAPGGLLLFDVICTGAEPLGGKGHRSTDDWAILFETSEDEGARRLTRTIETFRREPDHRYRRAREVHHVRIFGERAVTSWLEAAGFAVETARAYGTMRLLPRRVAFFASRG